MSLAFVNKRMRFAEILTYHERKKTKNTRVPTYIKTAENERENI
jgi:hypothetical protein